MEVMTGKVLEERLSAGLRAEQNVSGRFVADNYDKGREEEKK